MTSPTNRDVRERLEAKAFQFFTRKYVQRSDARQREMGLQYTEAETHDLAKETAALFMALLSSDEVEGMGGALVREAYVER